MTRFWKKESLLWAVYALLAIGVSVVKLSRPLNDKGYTDYENYLIFKNAPSNLLDFANPYAYYFNQTWDQYKYSPAFALGMWPFAQVPDWLGLPLWNLLNATVLLAAILRIPLLSARQRQFMAWFVLLELVTSLQNAQSNGLSAGLFLWTLIAFERGQLGRAGAWTAANAFLKILGGLSGLLGWMYPHRERFVLWAALWTVVLVLVPFLFLPAAHTWQVYGWWWELLRYDHAMSVGLSVQGWLHTWFGLQPPKMLVMGLGLVVLVASIYRVGMMPAVPTAEHQRLRTLAWASVLIWSVIFNHKAESPTFIIAMCGVALWYCASPQRRTEQVVLALTFALVSLSPTDLFPRFVRQHWVMPYVLKAVPCIGLWGWLSWQLLKGRNTPLVLSQRSADIHTTQAP